MGKNALLEYAKLGKLWDSLHTSYWFIPSLMAASAIVVAFIMVAIDQKVETGLFRELGWIYTGGPDGARALLSTVAGSMMAVTGTVFSITIVALTLASSQFGPRLLRNFMQDTGNQVVLGTFIATFIYCLLILRSVRGDEYDIFIPHLSVTFAIVLAVLSIGVLIYFIHHAAQSIQVDHVIANVSRDLHRAIDRLFPQKIGQTPSSQQQPLEDIPVDFDYNSGVITAHQSGYIEAIENERLLKIAQEYNLILRIENRPGHFVIKGKPLVLIFPRGQFYKKLNKEIRDTFIIGTQRTQQQDLEFCVDQIVEIAVRALSPSMNDPFTALRCIDRLSEGLCYLVQRDIPSPYRYDEHHQLRIIADPITFAGVTNTAFNQIRQYADSSVAVRIRLLEAIAQIADYTSNPDHCSILQHQAQMIQRGSLKKITEDSDLQDIEQQYFLTLQKLESKRN